MMDELGARLFAIWESTPYNGHWPQVTIIWEIDDVRRVRQDRGRPGPRRQPCGRGRQMVGIFGRHRRLGGGTNHVPRAEQQATGPAGEANFAAPLVIQEIMQTKPGRQDDYIRELERLYVPWSERTGKRWLGSFTTTFRLTRSSTTGRWTAAGIVSPTTTRPGRTARPPRSSPG